MFHTIILWVYHAQSAVKQYVYMVLQYVINPSYEHVWNNNKKFSIKLPDEFDEVNYS